MDHLLVALLALLQAACLQVVVAGEQVGATDSVVAAGLVRLLFNFPDNGGRNLIVPVNQRGTVGAGAGASSSVG